MSYSNRVNIHGYCSSFIHYFIIFFSLLLTLSGSQLSLSTTYSLLTLTSLSFLLSLSPSISPQATNLTDLIHCRYDLNKQTTPWRSLDGTISLARDPEMTPWRSSQGRDVWVLMGIDPWGVDQVDGGF